MPTIRDRLRDTADKLRNLGGPTDALDKRVTGVVDRATSDMMINPDWGVNMELVDIINSEPNQGCFEKTFRAIRRRLAKPNAKIQLLTLTLLETCVKNTGTEFHSALSESELLDEVLRLADPRRKSDLQVQDKIMILVEDCAHALQPPRYKTAYDTLKEWGVRFPVREKNEIGSGFNLPPTGRDSSAMAGVSEADQRAIQEALRDLASPPPPPVSVPQTRPPMDAEDSAEKIKSDLRVVANSVEVLKEALASISTNEPELIHQDYITDVQKQCVEIVPRLKQLITTANDESILAEALELNDQLGATLTQYDEVVENARKGTIGVIKEEPELLSFEDETPPSTTSSIPAQQGASASYQLPTEPRQVDQFAQLASGQEPIKTTAIDPFEELASQTPTGSTTQTIPPSLPTNVMNPGTTTTTIVPPPAPQQQQQQKEKDPFEDLITL